MARAIRDPNRVTGIIVASSAGDEAEVQLWGDPTTHRLLVDASASLVPATSGGWLIARDIDLDEASPAVVKASAGQVGGWYLYNNSAATLYVKIYNKATAPVLASDTPKMTICIPAGSAANVELSSGIEFDTGIGWACTTGVADDNAGAPAANDCVANLLYI
jgi:hypothetical protein